jgi:hypothetical protein
LQFLDLQTPEALRRTKHPRFSHLRAIQGSSVLIAGLSKTRDQRGLGR